MAVTMLMIPSEYPTGLSVDSRKTIIEGQLLPYNSSNALYTITSFSITSNVVTFTTSANTLTGGGGDAILVAGFEGSLAYLNGGYTTTSATSTTAVAALTHADVAATSCAGLLTLTPNYATGGLALGAFTNVRTGTAQAIGTIGPNDYPIWLEVKTMKGSAQNYKNDMTAQPPKVLDFTGITQATNASAIPNDSIQFRAEYIKNQF